MDLWQRQIEENKHHVEALELFGEDLALQQASESLFLEKNKRLQELTLEYSKTAPKGSAVVQKDHGKRLTALSEEMRTIEAEMRAEEGDMARVARVRHFSRAVMRQYARVRGCVYTITERIHDGEATSEEWRTGPEKDAAEAELAEDKALLSLWESEAKSMLQATTLCSELSSQCQTWIEAVNELKSAPKDAKNSPLAPDLAKTVVEAASVALFEQESLCREAMRVRRPADMMLRRLRQTRIEVTLLTLIPFGIT